MGTENAEWFYVDSGQQCGPVPEAVIRQSVSSGVLRPETPVWTDGMADWEPAFKTMPALVGPAGVVAAGTTGWFYPVPLSKFIVMSTVTFGLYEVYWSYRNWLFIKEHRGLKIQPFWRAWFAVFFTYDLLKQIKTETRGRGYVADYSAGWLAAAYILALIALPRLPQPYALLGVFSWVSLLPVLGAVNAANDAEGSAEANARYSGWDSAGIVVGGLWWALVILGAFLTAGS